MDLSEVCTEANSILVIIGWILTIFKIAIPLVIIGYGLFDLGKAVVSSKDEDIKKNAKTLGRRAIAGVCIFLIPNIVLWIFGLIPEFQEAGDSANFDKCKQAILTPWKSSNK